MQTVVSYHGLRLRHTLFGTDVEKLLLLPTRVNRTLALDVLLLLPPLLLLLTLRSGHSDTIRKVLKVKHLA